MARGLFGDRPASVVSLVEAPLSRSYAHKARIAFFTSTAVACISAAAILSFVMPPLWALSLALLIGAIVGFVVAALVRASAAAVASVRETSVLIAAFLAAPLAGERVGPGRLSGAALVVAGVALIAAG